MCGIFLTHGTDIEENKKHSENETLRNRGPDNSHEIIKDKYYFKFHRLSINDLSDTGNQPFIWDDLIFMCNGEILNFRELAQTYNIDLYSRSDCEIIGHLYKQFGFHRTVTLLNGYFAIVLLDLRTNILYAARDRNGVRAMYLAYDVENAHIQCPPDRKNIRYSYIDPKDNYDDQNVKTVSYYQYTFNYKFGIASTLSSFPKEFMTYCSQFKAGYTWNSLDGYSKYYSLYNEIYTIPKSPEMIYYTDIPYIKKHIFHLVHQAVDRCLVSDVKIGCFLSGGFDSSSVVAMLCYLNKLSYPIETFSIGFEGSPDLHYARLIANHFKTIHHEVIVKPEELLSELEKTIKIEETYDTTTIRAGCPMQRLARYVRENTDIKVLLSGEMVDELSGSYKEFKFAPNDIEFGKWAVHRTTDLCYFDLLRGDKCISYYGLEIRLPYADNDFIDFYMRIHPSLKMHKPMEKYLLRSAISHIMPSEVCWRTKEAFSDGVSTIENSWFSLIKKHIENVIYNDPQYAYLLSEQKVYAYNAPKLLETKYYRAIFDKLFPDRENVLPYYWVPNNAWVGDIHDPSARIL